MRTAFFQRLVVAILCGSLGCQGAPGFTTLSRSPGKAPVIAPTAPPPAVPPNAPGPPPPAKLTRAASAPATPIQRVNYVEESSAKAPGAGGAASSQAVVLNADDADIGDSPVAAFMHSLVPGSEPTFFIESSVMRGQTPLRDFFVSDRFLIASIVVAAVVIPFAVHDSRQPNPPKHGTQ